METYLIIIICIMSVAVISVLVFVFKQYSKKNSEYQSNKTQELSQNRASLIENNYLSNCATSNQIQDRDSKIEVVQKATSNPIDFQAKTWKQQIKADEEEIMAAQEFCSSLKELKKPFLFLIGQGGMHKTQIFNDLKQKAKLSQEKCKTYKDFTFAIFPQFILVDTPPFELDDDIDKRELCIKKFQTILYELGELIASFFIVCKFERTDLMKKNIMSVYKFVKKFEDKIQIIVSDFHLSEDPEDEVHLKDKFELFLQHQQEVIFYCQQTQMDKSIQKMIDSDLCNNSPQQIDNAHQSLQIENVNELKAEPENETDDEKFSQCCLDQKQNKQVNKSDVLSQNSECDGHDQQLIQKQSEEYVAKNQDAIVLDQQSNIQFQDQQKLDFYQKFFKVSEQILKLPPTQLILKDTIFEKLCMAEEMALLQQIFNNCVRSAANGYQN